jgi:pectate lyase
MFVQVETKLLKILLLPALALCLHSAGNAQQPAFPGAEGFGKYSRGGRGGIVLEVTNLDNSGTGSLRDALLSYKGQKRTIIFRVSGTIELMSPIQVKYDSCITIAGQTAPGDGICIKNYPLTLSDSRHIIIRFIRFRLGDEQPCVSPDCDLDAMSVRKCHHIILDHCSFSWSIDALLDLTVETGYSTVQYCILSEALLNSKHSKGAHSMAAGWDGNSHGDNGFFGGSTFHHNLIASCNSRTPRLDSYAGENNTGRRDLMDVVNNVVYNWAGYGAYGGEHADANWQNNYYKYGPSTGGTTGGKRDQIFQVDGTCKLYLAGNYVDAFPFVNLDNGQGIYIQGVKATAAQLDTILKPVPFGVWQINMQSAEEAFNNVLNGAGAVLPVRDSADKRIIADVLQRTGKIIDSQSEVEGWPVLKSVTAPEDTDHDGMPDAWEDDKDLDKNNPGDRNAIDTSGYTMLEKYINDFYPEAISSVTEMPDLQPAQVICYPNPFDGTVSISFILEKRSDIEVIICDYTGIRSLTLTQDLLQPGYHHFEWDNTESAGKRLPAGIYYCVIRGDDFQVTRKLVLLK